MHAIAIENLLRSIIRIFLGNYGNSSLNTNFSPVQGKKRENLSSAPFISFFKFLWKFGMHSRAHQVCLHYSVCVSCMCSGLLLQSLVILCTHSYTNINALKLHVQSFSQSPVLSRFPSLFPAHTSKLTEAPSRSRTANFCQITQTLLTRRFCAFFHRLGCISTLSVYSDWILRRWWAQQIRRSANSSSREGKINIYIPWAKHSRWTYHRLAFFVLHTTASNKKMKH